MNRNLITDKELLAAGVSEIEIDRLNRRVETRELMDMLKMAERRHGKPDAPVVVIRPKG